MGAETSEQLSHSFSFLPRWKFKAYLKSTHICRAGKWNTNIIRTFSSSIESLNDLKFHLYEFPPLMQWQWFRYHYCTVDFVTSLHILRILPFVDAASIIVYPIWVWKFSTALHSRILSQCISVPLQSTYGLILIALKMWK